MGYKSRATIDKLYFDSMRATFHEFEEKRKSKWTLSSHSTDSSMGKSAATPPSRKKTKSNSQRDINLRVLKGKGVTTKKANKEIEKAVKKVAKKSISSNDDEEAVRKREGYTAPLPKRNVKGELIFTDYPEMRPNMTPKEILQAGSFGGTYFRPIKSSVTGEKYTGVWKELPKNWLLGLDISKQVSSSTYHEEANTYKVKCGGSLEMWESSGWIHKQDPYGWFMWYCRFYLGRRTEDDERQVGRWKKCAGVKGRWRNNLIAKCARSGCAFDNFAVSPVVRQTLQHWGYRLTKEDFEKSAKKFR